MKKIIIGLVLALGALSVASAAAPSASAWESPARPKKTETVTFKVSMHCRNCVNKIQENIAFEKGVKDLKRREHIAEICELVGLKEQFKRVIRNLSKGYKQRVGMAQALTITYIPTKTTPEALEAAIRKLGYSVELIDAPQLGR